MAKYRVVRANHGFEWYHIEIQEAWWADWKLLYSASSIERCKEMIKNHKSHGSVNDCVYVE